MVHRVLREVVRGAVPPDCAIIRGNERQCAQAQARKAPLNHRHVVIRFPLTVPRREGGLDERRAREDAPSPRDVLVEDDLNATHVRVVLNPEGIPPRPARAMIPPAAPLAAQAKAPLAALRVGPRGGVHLHVLPSPLSSEPGADVARVAPGLDLELDAVEIAQVELSTIVPDVPLGIPVVHADDRVLEARYCRGNRALACQRGVDPGDVVLRSGIAAGRRVRRLTRRVVVDGGCRRRGHSMVRAREASRRTGRAATPHT